MQARKKTKVSQKNLIGILGGMGPAATVDFLSKIISATPATRDQDHIPLIVHDVPQIPDRSSAIENGRDDPFLPMLSGVRFLDAAGVAFIAIPCNTAHYWYDRLGGGCRAKILHISQAVLHELLAMPNRPRSVAILATRGTISADIYGDELLKAVERVVIPDEKTQRLIDHSITSVKGGTMVPAREAAGAAARLLVQQGAECLLLACTELPVAFSGLEVGIMTFDATDSLARVCVKASLGEYKVEMAG
ncbi:amino acid racemase [Mesorhizobium sp. LNHC252B00]|uniref:aspartate/glutamate racemase family protein n=1 Tax=Mesorhizobium sp. LNHC252B00 TaxID=1287252 RepID=UPI001FDAB123|nr:amino acid racemase [Mesorhizobium sp. LNHC252B00]